MQQQKRRSLILLLATVTLVGFPIVGWVIQLLVGEESLLALNWQWEGWPWKVALGIGLGTLIGLGAWAIINSKLLQPVREQYGDVIQSLGLNWLEVIYISLCAGVGEEILFRGVVQPHLGIWITAIGFVAIHGYLNPFNWRVCIYGTYLTLAIAGLGFITESMGLLPAITAHVVIDIILLGVLSFTKRKERVYL